MNLGIVGRVLGFILFFIGLFMTVPVLFGWYYHGNDPEEC